MNAPAFEDLFLTLPLHIFRQYIRRVNDLHRRDRNNVLATFDYYKVRPDRAPVRRMKNDRFWSEPWLTGLVNQMLLDYWFWRDQYGGGLTWSRLPQPLPNETHMHYHKRNARLMEPLMEVLLHELQYLNSQNSLFTQNKHDFTD